MLFLAWWIDAQGVDRLWCKRRGIKEKRDQQKERLSRSRDVKAGEQRVLIYRLAPPASGETMTAFLISAPIVAFKY